MSLLHHALKFELVYSDKEFYQQKCSQFSPFEYSPVAKEKLTENFRFRKLLFWKRKELDLNYLIKQGKLNGDWLIFKAWYYRNKGHLSFRGLSRYNTSSLNNVIVYGNDRYAIKPRTAWDVRIYRELGLRPQDFIWVYDNLENGWSEIFIGGGNRVRNRIMLIYDSRLLENMKFNGAHTLKDGVNSFKDALLAIVFVYLRF